ncbi:uncharacterized protein LOC115629833 [Scaptodrosophila lebanonensis]|uniref:Uncharacterized protein LOC115629833 n=1 Tax=Drosophila lebanonensis TaxID=7225 RepID=A0A6J2U313_DROLE|nr:uncharacterized protein LOC115629833 [Scaptodrosophila lebanonensis]
MLMEPNDFAPITVLRSQEHHFHMPPTTTTSALLHHQQPQAQLQQPLLPSAPKPRRFQAPVPTGQEQFRPIPNPQLIARADIVGGNIDSHSQAAQNFYPPFYHEAPPLGHSRPYFPGPPDGAPVLPTKYAEGPVPPQQRGFDAAILGSGDFGVLRGGTFYPEEEMPYHQEDNSDYIYSDANNGHGRPTEGFVQKYTYPEEQFANFRDFADINTPADSAFSQFVVVYAAKNATKSNTHPHPKNIFEQLELLDRQKALEEKALKKQQPSKSKSKLFKTKLQKKYKKKLNPKNIDLEPLLAMS